MIVMHEPPAIILPHKKQDLLRGVALFPGFLTPHPVVGVTSLSIFSTTVANTTTIAWPAGIQAGDLAVLINTCSNFGLPSAVVPTGFTANTNTTVSVLSRMMSHYKILDGTETGSITGMTGLVTLMTLYIFRGDQLITSVLPSVWNTEGTANDPAAQTVLASLGATPLIVFGSFYGSDGSVAFSTASPAFDAEVSAGAANAERTGYKIYNSSPADHTIDAVDRNNNILISGYLAIA